MFENMKNTRKQGNVGLGCCISYFTSIGAIVSIPLDDSQEYDLIVDINNKLNKIQVKTTSFIRNKKFEVMLKTCGGNQSFNTIKYFDKVLVDFIFILTSNGDKYLIPTDAISAKSGIVLGDKYSQYKI